MNASRVLQTLLVCGLFFCSACAERSPRLEFPFDHGPHADAVNEWWYFTGVLLTGEQKTVGFECTIFKRRLRAGRTGFGWLGHIAFSDPSLAEHVFAEARGGDNSTDFEEGVPDIRTSGFSYGFSEAAGFVIAAEAGGLALDLRLVPTRDVLPHGRDGIILMGDGVPSYYYSFTNLETSGSISIGGTDYAVASGRSWMDHQWGNYTVFGLMWDWFSVRFDDGAALMLFRFRDAFGNHVRSNWTFRSAAGEVTCGETFSVEASRIYNDVNGNCSYPLDWTIRVPAIDAALSVTPVFDSQALYDVMTPLYWEGLCSVSGTLAGADTAGDVYVELTGYCDLR